ncbi:MAG: FAD-dependent oxidoreductase [Candidatus Margulisiibacteriota bacterium]|jgi:alkyl hydroperoxide reductase subunit F
MPLDLVIIGGGPAGITAAVYAARKKMSLAVVAKEIGGQAAWSSNVENYTGFQVITGPELVKKFSDHLSQYKFEMREGVEATLVERAGSNFQVKLSDGQALAAKSVIIASGKRPRPLNVPGEREFRGRGVAYCATCDGPLFAGKTVAVVGGGNSALDAALQMERIAAKVYLINLAPALTGDPVMSEKLVGLPKVEIMNSAKITEIFGDQFVRGLKIDRAGRIEALALEGIFVEIGLTPNSALVDCVSKNELGEIEIDCAARTSCPGLFAAGDVTAVPSKQIIIAAGDGAKAALSAFTYLNTRGG